MTIYIVYKTTNLINNKFYIGKHKQDSYEFDGYLGSGTIIKDAIKKYGKESFLRETLATFMTEEECYIAEKDILSNLWEDPDCYNLESGGRGGKTVSEESRKRMSLSAKNRPRMQHTEKTKLLLSAAKLANNPGMTGKTHSEETKRKMKEKAEGRKHSAESKEKMSKNMKGRIPWNKGQTRVSPT